MGIPHKMMNIMPFRCRYCQGGFLAMEHISYEARKAGLHLIEMQREYAEKRPVWDTLAAEDPIFVNGFGHGNNNVYTGDSESPIFTSTECSILSGRIVYLLSCLTANGLGPAIIAAGGIAYGGYNIEWTWMAGDTFRDPYDDSYAEGFYRGTNEFPIALIQGDPVFRARDRSIAEYNRWIKIWETERAIDPYSADAIKWLIHDRDGLTVLGDLQATIVRGGVRTIMEVEVGPPATARSGEIFHFSGVLRDKDTGNPIPGKPIELWEELGAAPLAATTTDDDGRWGFDISFSPGIYKIFVRFNGDEYYSPGYTGTYIVEVSLSEMSEVVPPPSNVDAGEIFHFSGVLRDKDTGNPIPGKPIELWEELGAAPLAATTTDDDGRWGFDISFNRGVRSIYAKFPGDSDYATSSTGVFTIEVGFTMILVTAPPAGQIDAGEKVSFAGSLRSKATGAGVAGKPIDLYINQVKKATTITDESGAWTFEVTHDVEGKYYYQTKFPGDAEWVGVTTGIYSVRVGMPRIFGYDEIGRMITGATPDFMRGSWFTCPEPCMAQTITVYLQPHKFLISAKCAIYRKSDMSLVGSTMERTEFLEGKGWYDFFFPSLVPLEPGEYYLIIWSKVLGSWNYLWLDSEEGKGGMKFLKYGDFPARLEFSRIEDTKFSIYCTYILAAPPEYTLTISTTAGGTTDPAPGSYSYPTGTTARVTAIPSSGYLFDHWELDGAIRTENPIDVLMGADHTLHAVFATTPPPPPPEYTLTISATVGGTTDPAPGSYIYDEGTVARVTAIPSSGYLFDHWELDGIARAENPIDVLMDRDHVLLAVFAAIPPPEYTLTITSTAGGTTEPAPGTYINPEGTLVRVTAFPASGHRFSHWELDGIPYTANPIDVLMDRDHLLHAVFSVIPPPPEYTLTISTTAGGTTDPTPGPYLYPEGTVARVAAIPASGYIFDHWELDSVARTENPIDVLMNKDHTLHAVFKAAPPPERMLTISATVGGTTDPVPGAYYYPDGSVAMVIAYPDMGYLFDHWLIDGVTRETENPISILMDRNHTLHAVFIEAPPVPPPPKTKYIALGLGAAVLGVAYYSRKKQVGKV